MVRRPNRSLKDDHHSGNIDILSMYNEMDRFVIVVVVSRSLDTWDSEADGTMVSISKNHVGQIGNLRKNIELPMGAVIPATATMKVTNHFFFRE